MEKPSTTTVFCSNKLGHLIGKDNLQKLPSRGNFNWNGDLFSIDGRKCVVFMHKPTFYCFYVLDVLKKDVKDFNHFFADGLMLQLRFDQLSNPLLEAKLWLLLDNIQLAPTDNDRPVIGRINHFIHIMESFMDDQEHVTEYKSRYRGNTINEEKRLELKEKYPRLAMKKWLQENL